MAWEEHQAGFRMLGFALLCDTGTQLKMSPDDKGHGTYSSERVFVGSSVLASALPMPAPRPNTQ